MIGSTRPATGACIVDNMVLAMFVDADQVALLAELGGGHMFVSPTVIDPDEIPPFHQQPTAEFARGAYYFQQRLGLPLDAVRLHRRVTFYAVMGTAWRPAVLSTAELQMTVTLLDPATWQRVTAIDPLVRVKKVDRGEAECAAVALTRNWTLWTDDAAIIALLTTLYPGHPVERISDLLARGVRTGLISCQDAADLYNNVFKGQLNLWTRFVLSCQGGNLVAQ